MCEPIKYSDPYNIAVAYIKNKFKVNLITVNVIRELAKDDNDSIQIALLLTQYCYGEAPKSELENKLMSMGLL